MTGIVVRTHRQELVRRRRVLVAVGGTLLILGFFIGFVAGMISAGGPRKNSARAVSQVPARPTLANKAPIVSPTATAPSVAASPPANAPVVAWQPSHQDEHLKYGYREYQYMGSLAAIAAQDTTRLRSVIAWDTSDGLTGDNSLPHATNTVAFDQELATSNDASATYFVGLQTVTADMPGMVVYYQENDDVGAVFARFLADRLAARWQMNHLGRLGVRFYSLDKARNRAPYRVVVSIQDTNAGLARLSSRARQRPMALALARAVQDFARQNR